VRIGAEAPDFTLPNAIGGEITLSDLQGKGCVALVFLRGFQ
jgi:peroxiredoxin